MKEHDKMQANTSEIVEWHLRKIGVQESAKGFGYLKEAIILAVENPKLARKVATELYPVVAQKLNKSVWTISNRINDVVRRLFNDSTDIEKFKEYFGNSISAIYPTATASELIAAITQKIIEEPPVTKAISEQLSILGFPMNLEGYISLKEAIEIAIENPEMLLGDVVGIYSIIAEKNNLNVASVAKKISIAILSACSRVNSEDMKIVFGNTLNYQNGKPTSLAVIVAVRERVIPEAPQIKTAVRHLQNIGIPMHLVGFHYMKRAIELAMENQDMLESENDEFHRVIAEDFCTKHVNIEYAIRNVINIAYKYTSKEILKQYFGEQKPNIIEFVRGVMRADEKLVSVNP